MSRRQPSFTVNVDMTNPGQVLACCGLLELAHRLWPGVEGWFEDTCFCLSALDRSATLKALMDCFLQVDAKLGTIHGVIRGSDRKPVDIKKVVPIEIDTPFNLRLAWWLDEPRSMFTALKLWSGRQSSWDVFCQLRKAGGFHPARDEHILGYSAPSRVGLVSILGRPGMAWVPRFRLIPLTCLWPHIGRRSY